MNLFLLVEGKRTEAKLYPAWIQCKIPDIQRVYTLQDLVDNRFMLVSGSGYPAYLQQIDRTLHDIAEHPGKVEHYLVCIDSEDWGADEKAEEIRRHIGKALDDYQVYLAHPELQTHVIVQHCCIESWLLGHQKLLKRNPQSDLLRQYIQHYDVRQSDPEHMPTFPGSWTRAQFHERYLREMFQERGLCYSKTRPADAAACHYLEGLEQRTTTTPHLSSFRPFMQLMHTISRTQPQEHL